MYPDAHFNQRTLLRIGETEAIDPHTGEHFLLTRKHHGEEMAFWWGLFGLGFVVILLWG